MNSMNLLKFTILVAAAAVLATLPANAQRKRVSPHETVSATIDGSTVKITYGRPYSKDPKSGDIRKIWGGLVPYDKAWRTGADEATQLVTPVPLAVGDTTIPAGTYTLYTIPSASGVSKLAFSSTVGKWGIPVDEAHDVARVDLKKSALDKTADQFTIAIEGNSSGGGVIKLMWENTQYSVDFAIKK
jgi:hypothetical protein